MTQTSIQSTSKTPPLDVRTNVDNNDVKRRRDFEVNHIKIQESFMALMAKHKRCPTYQEIADDTNLDHETVYRHMKSIDLTSAREKMLLFTDRVILSTTNQAMAGDVAAQRLYYQVVNDWSEKHRHEVGRAGEFDPMKYSDDEILGIAAGKLVIGEDGNLIAT